MARLIIVLMLATVVVGFLWPMLIRLYRGRIRDGVRIRRERTSYFVLIAACVALSFLISAVLWWFRM
jgi:Protein of unknown function (DUF2905)